MKLPSITVVLGVNTLIKYIMIGSAEKRYNKDLNETVRVLSEHVFNRHNLSHFYSLFMKKYKKDIN